MADLFARIRKRIAMTIRDFRSDCRFSLRFAVLRMCVNLCGRAGLTSVSRAAGKRKDAFIRDHLKKTLMPLAEQYAGDENLGTPAPHAPIWICWWTGEETAPPLVKRCIRSIREMAGDHPVYLIHRDNYEQYLQIPSFMLEKLKTGQMGFAHLADFIRVKLLAEHGGLWLDATIFCSNTVPESCFEMPVFTCKSPRQACGYISEMRWVTFCLGGWKGNVFYRFLADCFARYWKENPVAIDYLFFDFVIEFAYDNLPAIRQLMDNIPENNLHRDDLQAAMNNALPASDFHKVLKEDTCLYKLSWRENYADTTADGKESIYRFFVREEATG